jgi:hypothetical protein
MASARAGHTATLLPDETVLIAGGNVDGSASAALYNPTTGTFSATAHMTIERQSHTATLLQNGEVLLAGGVTAINSTTDGSASAELFDSPAENRQSP